MIKEDKKYYSSPKLEVIKLDSEISLILLSPPDHPPGGRNANTNSFTRPSPFSNKPQGTPPSSGASPFGGNKPDFSDM